MDNELLDPGIISFIVTEFFLTLKKEKKVVHMACCKEGREGGMSLPEQTTFLLFPQIPLKLNTLFQAGMLIIFWLFQCDVLCDEKAAEN